jgi:hypothetical protein
LVKRANAGLLGLAGVPAIEVSTTVTVQTDGVFTVTGLVQLTVVEVVRGLIVTVADIVVVLAL